MTEAIGVSLGDDFKAETAGFSGSGGGAVFGDEGEAVGQSEDEFRTVPLRH